MKSKLTVLLCLGLLTTLLLSACSSKTKEAKIKVSSDDWSGWSETDDSKTKEESYTVKEGDSIELGGKLDLTIKITSITDNEVRFETNTPMSANEDGTIDLTTEQTKFKLTKEKSLELATPTMDAGDTFILSLE